MSLRRMGSFAVFVVATSMPGARAETLLHYNFNNGSGTTVTDLSGFGNHGTLVGFVDTSAGAGVFAQSEGWVAGGGLSTLEDAVWSYVDTPLPLNALGTGPFTLEYRASFTAPGASSHGGDAGMFAPAIGGSHGFDNFVSLLLFGRRDNVGLEERLPGDLESSVPISGLQPWHLGTADDVHHVALTYVPLFPTGGAVQAYVNGVLVSDPVPVLLPTANFADALGNFRILGSGNDPNLAWDGVIHGVAISNEALTPGNFVIPEPSADFDGDGNVDGHDFLAWQRGESPNPLSTGDLALWQDQYGTLAAVGANVVVPEPTTILLGAVGVAFAAGLRRCRASQWRRMPWQSGFGWLAE